MSIHDGHRQRMRQGLIDRPDGFPDHTLLEILLYYANPRGDTNPTAHHLMERFGSISGVMDASPAELMKVPGVGEHTVALLKLTKELGGRYQIDRVSMGEQVRTTKDACRLLKPYFYGARQERIFLLCLDGKGKSLAVRAAGEGNVNTVEVVARNVVEAALSLNASAVILAHNHPSGVALPSADDVTTTRRLYQTLSLVNVTLLDHLIFADGDAVSMRDSGYSFMK